MTGNNEVTISIQEHNRLLEDERVLNALYMFGVEDWEGYEEAIKSIKKDEYEEEEEEEEE